MSWLKLVGVLMDYPQDELWQHGGELLEAADDPILPAPRRTALADFVRELLAADPLEAQERWLAMFDRGRSMSLLLFEHIHGESRDRGSAMIDLLQEYWKRDFDASAAELPDYVPLFLEFLSLLPADEALELLGDAVHVLATIGRKLDANGSPYATAFQVLEALSPVAAQELAEPPVRDMDEAMEMFGPSMDGVEPLLKPGPQVAVVQMPASRRQAAAAQSIDTRRI